MSEAGKKIVSVVIISIAVTGIICMFIFTHPNFDLRNNGIQTVECGYGTLANNSAPGRCICDRFHAIVSDNESYRNCTYQRKSRVFAALLQAIPLFSWVGAGFIYVELYWLAGVCLMLTGFTLIICISAYQDCRQPPTDYEAINNIIGSISIAVGCVALLIVISPALLGVGFFADGNNIELGP